MKTIDILEQSVCCHFNVYLQYNLDGSDYYYVCRDCGKKLERYE